MFTGIVEEIGTVAAVRPGSLTFNASIVTKGTVLGASIAVNGTCLTVTQFTDNQFTIEIMPETLKRTNLGQLAVGDKVNLERALTMGGQIGGHLVQGHIDGTGRIVAMTPNGNALLIRVEAPPEVMKYIVEKGFITVDGISLTVVSRDNKSFEVSLVGFTRANTILGLRRPGAIVNLEADIIAKYVEQYLQAARPSGGITQEFLQENGY